MNRFVARQNINHLADQFSFAAAPEKRDTLARLLVDEEDKLGRGYEQLEIADHRLSIASIMISKQEDLVERYEMEGHDTALVREVLVSLQVSKSLFETFRDQIMRQIGNSRL
jgi:hypothetical protein